MQSVTQLSSQSRQIILSDSSTIPGKVYNFLLAIEKGQRADIFTYDPETVLIIASELVGKQLPPFASAKLLAGLLAYGTNAVTHVSSAFINYANLCIADEMPDLSVFDPANMMECGGAVVDVSIFEAGFEEDGNAEPLVFSEEVRKYIGGILLSEGMIESFAPFSMAIMPPTDRDVESAALADVMIDTDTTGRVQIVGALSLHAAKIYGEIRDLRDDEGKPIISWNEFSAIMREIGLA